MRAPTPVPLRRLLIGPLLLLVPGVSAARSGAPSAGDTARVRYEIASLSLAGNSALTELELTSQMVTKETPGWFSKFLYNSISETLGRQNEYFDAATFGADLDRLRSYYDHRGFSEVRIDTVFAISEEDRSVDISLRIEEGYRSIVDSLSCVGLDTMPEEVQQRLMSDRLITQGDPFNLYLLEDEVKRILRVLYDYGHPNARYVRDSSYARRYVSTRNYDVRLAFVPGRQYWFGGITVRQQVDTAQGETFRPDITEQLVLDHLDYRAGDRYSLERKTVSESNLNRLGIFELRSLDLLVPPPEDSSVIVPSLVTLRPLDKHELAPDLFVSDEDGAFNIGTSLAYTNRNFLGGARRFTTRLRFRTQTIGAFPHYFERNSSAVSNLDLTFEIVDPYVFSNKTTGSWSFSAVLDKQKPYIQNIFRNKIGVTTKVSKYATGFFDWTVESVDLETNDNFATSSQDPDVQRALRLLQSPQRNSFLSATVARDRSNDLFSPSAGYILSVTLEESGVISNILNNILPKLPFTEFYRAIGYGRWYTDRSGRRFSVLAFKARVGWEEKYGKSRADTSRVIPQTHRFFAGGGGSVRGWPSRELIARGDPQLGGNFLAEASLESRVNILQSLRDGLWDKIWLVQFLDVGNLWLRGQDIQFTTVAAAIGLGLRYDTAFGPFRIDWGLRVYDPRAPSGQKWITQKKLISQTFNEGAFHFGIGHAF